MKTIKLILVILWMALIFYFSHNNSYVSSSQSSNFIYNSIEFVSKVFNIKVEEKKLNNIIEIVEYPIRKCAHIFLYFVLSILLVSFLKSYNVNYKKIFIYTFLFCLLYAILDEIHQIFILGRNGSIKDVLIDSLGIYLGIITKLKK